jgi:hypothetical protein
VHESAVGTEARPPAAANTRAVAVPDVDLRGDQTIVDATAG